jgi:hypothetical protein
VGFLLVGLIELQLLALLAGGVTQSEGDVLFLSCTNLLCLARVCVCVLPAIGCLCLLQVQRAVAARQQVLESELERLHLANASALAKLETDQRAAAESMRSAGEALQAVIDRADDAEAFDAARQVLEQGLMCSMSSACRRGWWRWSLRCRLCSWPPSVCGSRATESTLWLARVVDSRSCWRALRARARCRATLMRSQ